LLEVSSEVIGSTDGLLLLARRPPLERHRWMKKLWNSLIAAIRRTISWGDRRIPRGVRSIIGVLFVIGGVVGFLPVLGFWMLPAGLALIALDIPPLRRRVLAWVARQEAETERNTEGPMR
jgi:hypothetical protein